MILPGYIGPLEKWQVELRKASKSGILERLEWLIFVFNITPEKCLAIAKEAKKEGRWIDHHNAHLKFMQNPSAALEASVKRSKAAKKAARKRKKATR